MQFGFKMFRQGSIEQTHFRNIARRGPECWSCGSFRDCLCLLATCKRYVMAFYFGHRGYLFSSRMRKPYNNLNNLTVWNRRSKMWPAVGQPTHLNILVWQFSLCETRLVCIISMQYDAIYIYMILYVHLNPYEIDWTCSFKTLNPWQLPSQPKSLWRRWWRNPIAGFGFTSSLKSFNTVGNERDLQVQQV